MKHPNSISQINIDRDKEMYSLYQKAKRMVEWPTTTAKVYEFVSQMPTSCYYLSFDAAYRYIRLKLKGKKQKFGKTQQRKRDLFESFYQEFLNVKRQYEGQQVSIYRLVEIALEHPAPHLGMSAACIRKKIKKYFSKLSPAAIIR